MLTETCFQVWAFDRLVTKEIVREKIWPKVFTTIFGTIVEDLSILLGGQEGVDLLQ